MRHYLNQSGIEDSAIDGIDGEIEKEIGEAVSFAEQSPEPSVEEFMAEISFYGM